MATSNRPIIHSRAEKPKADGIASVRPSSERLFAPSRESDRAVRAPAAQFETLESGKRKLATAASPAGREGVARGRILLAEARVQLALARLLPALGEIAAAQRAVARGL